MTQSKPRSIVVIAAIVIIAAFAYRVLTMPDKRSLSEKISDTVQDFQNGKDHPEQQLEDRTPGQKLGDEVKDIGDKIKEETKP